MGVKRRTHLVGRKRLDASKPAGGNRRCLTLTDADMVSAAAIGDGNASRGIRSALEFFMDQISYSADLYPHMIMPAGGASVAVDYYCRRVLGIAPAFYAKGGGHAFGPDVPDQDVLEPYLLERNMVGETRSVEPWSSPYGREEARFEDGRPWPSFNTETFMLRDPMKGGEGARAGCLIVVSEWDARKPTLLAFSKCGAGSHTPDHVREALCRIFTDWDYPHIN